MSSSSSHDHRFISRRTALGLAAAAATATIAGCGGTSSPAASGTSAGTNAGASASNAAQQTTPSPTPQLELPRGGRTLFPTYRLFGYSGAPYAPGQGRLGIGDLDQRVVEMEKRGQAYATTGKKVLPVMELIATTAQPRPGKDGMYRSRISTDLIDTWLAEARKRKAYFILNIQPGRANFIDELKVYETYLKMPDVGVALDPEWAVDPGQVPGHVFGHTSGAELNTCADYLEGLVTAGGLPQKLMVYHQLNPGVVRHENQLKAHANVAMVKSIDGIGSPGAKEATWKRVIATLPKFVHPGFKLFYQEDVQTGGRLMTPTEVLALKPTPDYVLYE